MTDSAIDPELATAISRLEADGWLPLLRDDVAEARRNYRELALIRRGEAAAVGSVYDDVVPGQDADVAVRVYEPAGERRGITVLWLHGGGWVLGDLDTADGAARRVCTHLGATVISVDYRLAPEHPHPAPVTDAHTALRWAATLRLSDRLVIGGDSAGAGLAAGAALLARDWGPRVDAQLLLYPGLDPAMSSPSITENAAGPFLTRADLEWFWGHYVPDPGLREDPALAPLGDPEGLDGLAPAVVATAELDPLRDEGRAYADALEAAGVAVRRPEGAHLVHGYFGLAAASAAARAEGDRALDALAELLAT